VTRLGLTRFPHDEDALELSDSSIDLLNHLAYQLSRIRRAGERSAMEVAHNLSVALRAVSTSSASYQPDQKPYTK
jgi:hypothetical protein